MLLAACAVFGMLGGCGGGGGGDDPPGPPANVAPQANAGAAQTVNSGVTVTLNGSASTDSDGSISSYAWTQTAGPAVALSSSTIAQPTFPAPIVGAATALSFSLVVTDNDGATSAASAVSVTVNAPVAGAVTITGVIRYERAPFQASAPFGLNYGAPVLRPARGVVLRVMNAAGTTQIGTPGVTDVNGNYSFNVPGNTDVMLRVEARMQQGVTPATPRWNVRVQDGTAGDSPYSYNSASFNSSAGTQDVVIPMNIGPSGVATGTRHSGPFAILDTIRTAIDTVVGVSPNAVFPNLYVDWSANADGTYFTTANGQHITLRGDLTEDTEEFDPHVVAHEFGHYIEHNFSRSDSIGGPHALTNRLDMRVAFGEGFGYGFAAIVLNDPNARDSFRNNGQLVSGRFNVEANPGPGLGSDPVGCWCSESSVWSILWDLYDPANDDPIEMGFQPLWDVLVGAQRTTPAFTSIFSFITALKESRPGDVAAINTLVSAQNINAATIDAFATTETNTPYPGLLPLYASITRGGAPVVVRSIDDGGLYNRAGNRRYFRYEPSSAATVNISLATSNPDPEQDPDFVVFNSGVVRLVRQSAPPGPETGSLATTVGQTYLIDAYDCANGCSTEQGMRGDYDLTVTVN